MVRRHRVGAYRFAEFLELVHSDQKADLIDGVIYLASPENIEHNNLLFWLGTIMRQYVEERRLGMATVNKVAFHLSDHTAPEPDLAVVRTERLSIVRHGYVDGPPDVAVEIVSADSVERDYEDKRKRYEEAGVWEYWILDPDEQSATFLVRRQPTAGGFVEAALDGTVFRSTALPGFWLDVAWAWSPNRPSTLSVVQTLLRESMPG